MVLDWYPDVSFQSFRVRSGSVTEDLSRQNSVVELYSLLKFLRIKPFSNWNSFNLQIAKPVQTGRGGSTAMKRLQVGSFCIPGHVMLRFLFVGRPKADHASATQGPISQREGSHRAPWAFCEYRLVSF